MDSTFMQERNRLQKVLKEKMPAIHENFDQLLKIALEDGALPSKIKELIALGISVTERCEPCMQYHIQKAKEKGATEDEIIEAMQIGYEMGVGVIIPPLRKIIDKELNRE